LNSEGRFWGIGFVCLFVCGVFFYIYINVWSLFGKKKSLFSGYGYVHLNCDGACKAALSFCKDYLLPAWIPNKTSSA